MLESLTDKNKMTENNGNKGLYVLLVGDQLIKTA